MKRITSTAIVAALFGVCSACPSWTRPQEKPASAPKVSAIQVLMIESDEVKLPAEFQIALYEHLIQEMQKRGGFQHVYRDGDRTAKEAGDIVILRSTVRGFKQGSERARQVTTVVGKTAIDIHCQFTDRSGNSLLERDLQGKVLFFGGNLNATLDFAKKAARVAHDNFSVESSR